MPAARSAARGLPTTDAGARRRLGQFGSSGRRARAPEPDERTKVLEILHSEPFIDTAPPTVFATLLDQGLYLASISTMYRVQHSVDEVRERRGLARHPAYVKPELIACHPNVIWSWVSRKPTFVTSSSSPREFVE
jgi:putative transposase